MRIASKAKSAGYLVGYIEWLESALSKAIEVKSNKSKVNSIK